MDTERPIFMSTSKRTHATVVWRCFCRRSDAKAERVLLRRLQFSLAWCLYFFVCSTLLIDVFLLAGFQERAAMSKRPLPCCVAFVVLSPEMSVTYAATTPPTNRTRIGLEPTIFACYHKGSTAPSPPSSPLLWLVRLWYFADSDLLSGKASYRLQNTGQGLNR